MKDEKELLLIKASIKLMESIKITALKALKRERTIGNRLDMFQVMSYKSDIECAQYIISVLKGKE